MQTYNAPKKKWKVQQTQEKALRTPVSFRGVNEPTEFLRKTVATFKRPSHS